MPKKDDEFNMNWRKNIVDMVTKIQVVDANLKRQAESSLHFFYETLSWLYPLFKKSEIL